MHTTEPFRSLSNEELTAYSENGVVPIRGLISPDWLKTLAEAIEADIANPGPFYHGYDSDEGKFHGNLRLWENDKRFEQFCLKSILPGVAQQFFSSKKVNLLYDQLFVKESNTANRTRWHNDQPYWAMRGSQVLSFWIALDETTPENGALEFIRGSHKWNRWFQPETFGNTSTMDAYERNPDYEPMPDVEAERSEYDIVSWDLMPGDAYVFHGLTVHGAPGNLSNSRRRRGYTVRYTGDDVVYDSRPGTNKGIRSATLKDGDPLDSEIFPRLIG